MSAWSCSPTSPCQQGQIGEINALLRKQATHLKTGSEYEIEFISAIYDESACSLWALANQAAAAAVLQEPLPSAAATAFNSLLPGLSACSVALIDKKSPGIVHRSVFWSKELPVSGAATAAAWAALAAPRALAACQDGCDSTTEWQEVACGEFGGHAIATLPLAAPGADHPLGAVTYAFSFCPITESGPEEAIVVLKRFSGLLAGAIACQSAHITRLPVELSGAAVPRAVVRSMVGARAAAATPCPVDAGGRPVPQQGSCGCGSGACASQKQRPTKTPGQLLAAALKAAVERAAPSPTAKPSTPFPPMPPPPPAPELVTPSEATIPFPRRSTKPVSTRSSAISVVLNFEDLRGEATFRRWFSARQCAQDTHVIATHALTLVVVMAVAMARGMPSMLIALALQSGPCCTLPSSKAALGRERYRRYRTVLIMCVRFLGTAALLGHWLAWPHVYTGSAARGLAGRAVGRLALGAVHTKVRWRVHAAATVAKLFLCAVADAFAFSATCGVAPDGGLGLRATLAAQFAAAVVSSAGTFAVELRTRQEFAAWRAGR